MEMAAKILIIDHNDSFTFNLVQLLEEAKVDCIDIVQVDQIDLGTLSAYDGIILSPGPGLPGDHPKIFEILSFCTTGPRKIPVLGICLGLQAIAVHFGGSLYNLGLLQHGTQTSLLQKAYCPVFEGLDFPLVVGRYHSWAVDPKTLPLELEITSMAVTAPLTDSSTGTIMSVHHTGFPVYGLQFHPESYMSPQGPAIMKNWLKVVVREKTGSPVQKLETGI